MKYTRLPAITFFIGFLFFCYFIPLNKTHAQVALPCFDFMTGKTIPCKTTETQTVTPDKNLTNQTQQQTCADGSVTSMGTYCALAPLPGFSKVIDEDVEGGGAGSFTLASYIRTLVRIAIGVIGILAVVMIVVSGVQYMGSGMITEKEAAKSRLTGAVFGLILAISSVLILRTINPQLTNLTIGDSTFKQGVSAVANGVEIPEQLVEEYEREDLPNNTVGPDGKSTACKGGIINIDTVNQKGIGVCADIAENYKNMIAAAKKDGVILTAYGARSMATQIALRKQNCGGSSQYSVYEKPSGQCKPPTARPGKSMHQQGLAFDIGVNGKTICFTKNASASNTAQCRANKNPGFIWLEAHAKTYGFYNLPVEAWHWSVNGK